MSEESQQSVEDVLEFWLGSLDADGLATPEKTQSWWKKDPEFDAEIRRRFATLFREVNAGLKPEWMDTPRGALASVLVLDQFSRNMFRGSADMYAGDERAREAAERAISRGFDKQLPTDARVFLYMPFMHAEELEAQERCVALFNALAKEVSGNAAKRVTSNQAFAVQHRDIVLQFNRFPHRNSLLGRCSTEKETEFLSKPGSSF